MIAKVFYYAGMLFMAFFVGAVISIGVGLGLDLVFGVTGPLNAFIAHLAGIVALASVIIDTVRKEVR